MNARHGNPFGVLFGFFAAFTISAAASGTEGGGSQVALGSATILQGLQPTPPGFNLINYDLYYVANRLNDSHGNKKISNFHVDTMVSFVKLDYSLLEPIG